MIFGTDGVRARINTGPMTAENILRLALAAGKYFTASRSKSKTAPQGADAPQVVIGKDTRISGYMVEAALQSGFASIGMDAVLVGPLPTPGVAYLTRELKADFGVMISASHNPYFDNGLKLFGPDGYKLPDEAEAAIAGIMSGHIALADAENLGRGKRLLDGVERYTGHLAAMPWLKGVRLDGLKVVVDCAHGAAYKAAPEVLRQLGAEVIAICDAPDGFNINLDCGAVHPNTMAKAVVEHGADAGICLDGDADRLIMADETGAVLDGDACLAVIGDAMRDAGSLKGNTIVGTLMTNHGFARWCGEKGITLERAPVGDRYVLEMMRGGGFNLGGEPSGHILMADHATSGDGIMAALYMLAALKHSGRPASESLRRFTPCPQTIINIDCADRARITEALASPEYETALDAARKSLGDSGRIVVRPSGTELLVRVMVEAGDVSAMEAAAAALADTVRGLVS